MFKKDLQVVVVFLFLLAKLLNSIQSHETHRFNMLSPEEKNHVQNLQNPL